jgi:hypothetical protein
MLRSSQPVQLPGHFYCRDLADNAKYLGRKIWYPCEGKLSDSVPYVAAVDHADSRHARSPPACIGTAVDHG